jgi:hypothetical protein
VPLRWVRPAASGYSRASTIALPAGSLLDPSLLGGLGGNLLVHRLDQSALGSGGASAALVQGWENGQRGLVARAASPCVPMDCC